MRAIVVAGDRQIPYQDKDACRLLLKFLRELQPDEYIENGDLLDLATLSKYAQVPNREEKLEEQLQEGGYVLQDLREAMPNARIRLIEGNHDFRLKSYLINKARELYGLHGRIFREYLQLDKQQIEYVESSNNMARWSGVWLKIPRTEVYVGHYNRVSKHSAYTAKTLIDDYGVSIVQNHTHRAGFYLKSYVDGRQLFGVENGCLCSMQQPYSQFSNWQHAFTILWITDEGRVFPELIWMQNYQFYYQGKLWKL